MLEIDGHTGNQAAAADRDEHRIHIGGDLTQHFLGYRALSGDHLRVVVGMHEMHAGFFTQLHGMG